MYLLGSVPNKQAFFHLENFVDFSAASYYFNVMIVFFMQFTLIKKSKNAASAIWMYIAISILISFSAPTQCINAIKQKW